MDRGRMSPTEVKKYLKKSDTTLLETLKFVFSGVLNRKSLLIINVVLLTAIAGLNFIVPQFTQQIIDHAITRHDLTALRIQVGWLLMTTVMLGVVTFASTYLMQMLSQRAITQLRLQTYQRILKQDYAYFQNAKTGDLMVRLTSDISNLQNLISSDSFGIIGNIFTFIAVLTFLYIQNWQLALLVSLTFPVLFVTIRFFRGKIRQAYMKIRVTNSQISNQLQGTMTEIELIKSYTTEREETARFAKVVAVQNNYQLEATRWQAIFQPLVNLINTVGTAIVLAFGGWLVIENRMTVGALVAYLSYLVLLQDPIRSFSRLLTMFQNAQVSYDRIKEVMGAEPVIINAMVPQKFPMPLQDGITFNQVAFHYSDTAADSLQSISLHIPAGKTTALVGRSGAGKSTLIRLLMRFYDKTAGQIIFDDIPIEKIDLTELRRHIAIVSQDVTIVDGTIADNIAYGTANVTDAILWDAAERAAVADFIRTLPHGMATPVGERGVKLSGGQKQRLSIARALVKDAPIVILDEATAALDNESEKIIQQALDNLMTHKTTIVIAHRLSTIHNADQIVVLDQGAVAQQGVHAELLAQNGIYQTLYNAQFA